MNLLESLKHVGEQAVKASGLRIHKIPGDERVVLIEQNGSNTERSLPAPLRSHSVEFLDDLIELTKDKAERSGRRELWHNADSITLILDADDRREKAVMSLIQSDVWIWIESVSGSDGLAYGQRDLIKLLRTKLARAIESMELADLLSSLKSITFRRREEASSEAERGRDALGKSIEQECAGIDRLPEFITVTTPVYTNVDGLSEVSVKLALLVDFERQAFTLAEVGEQIGPAMLETQRSLGDALAAAVGDDDVDVYQGTP